MKKIKETIIAIGGGSDGYSGNIGNIGNIGLFDTNSLTFIH